MHALDWHNLAGSTRQQSDWCLRSEELRNMFYQGEVRAWPPAVKREVYATFCCCVSDSLLARCCSAARPPRTARNACSGDTGSSQSGCRYRLAYVDSLLIIPTSTTCNWPEKECVPESWTLKTGNVASEHSQCDTGVKTPHMKCIDGSRATPRSSRPGPSSLHYIADKLPNT